MIDPDGFLDVARLLAKPPTRGAPKQVKLRRAISSAYYALFHHLIETATRHFVGADQRQPSYAIVYRSFEHGDLRKVCNQAQQLKLSPELQKSVGFPAFGAEIRECAILFVELQQFRHEADYNPAARISLSDASIAIKKAEDGIANLNRAPKGERIVFLTLLHFRIRP
jgi:hypothetical protein